LNCGIDAHYRAPPAQNRGLPQHSLQGGSLRLPGWDLHPLDRASFPGALCVDPKYNIFVLGVLKARIDPGQNNPKTIRHHR
jgi:hypothetical protein